MEPTRYEFPTDVAKDIGVPKQTLTYAHNNKRPLSLKERMELRFSILNGWIEI